MVIVADTNIFLAVALNEPERPRIVDLTTGHTIAAPAVLPFEIGNALASMMKKRVLDSSEMLLGWDALQAIPVTLHPIDIRSALKLSAQFSIYAYDAYFLECALQLRAPILTLDKPMARIARQLSIPVLE